MRVSPPSPTQDESGASLAVAHLGEVVTGFGATELAWKMTRVVARHRTLLRPRVVGSTLGKLFR
jgi:hypothetical protein